MWSSFLFPAQILSEMGWSVWVLHWGRDELHPKKKHIIHRDYCTEPQNTPLSTGLAEKGSTNQTGSTLFVHFTTDTSSRGELRRQGSGFKVPVLFISYYLLTKRPCLLEWTLESELFQFSNLTCVWRVRNALRCVCRRQWAHWGKAACLLLSHSSQGTPRKC